MSYAGSAKVVVAYDGSPEARAAARWAAAATDAGDSLIFVHAFALPSEWLGASMAKDVAAAHTLRGQQILDELIESEPELSADRAVETELVGGDAAEVIARVARVSDAREIVLGSHGAGRARALLGSVAQDVIHLADRPVVVVPRQGAVDV